MDNVSAPLFSQTQDVIISVTDLEHKVLDAKATLKMKVENDSGGEVIPVSTLTFTQGKSFPENGMTFKIAKSKKFKRNGA